MFFDTQVFIQFVKDCRTWGINCPVVPGLMCLNAYGGFKKMTKFCKTRVPADLEVKMEALKDASPDDVKVFGVEFGAQMCKDLIDFGVHALHFYTLNLEKVVYGTLDAIGFLQNAAASANEADASTMTAVGSAWARVGDTVKCVHGTGVVTEMKSDGSAVIAITDPKEEATHTMAKGEYEKVF
jgi:hypothetical protein